MTEQQYRVIADRDKGDEPAWADVRYGDLATTKHIYGADSAPILVRIERPVPTTDEPDDHYYRAVRISDGLVAGPWGRGERAQITDDTEWREETSSEAGWVAVEHRSVPTREQIAEMLFHAEYSDTDRWDLVREHGREPYLCMADAVLALLNRADR